MKLLGMLLTILLLTLPGVEASAASRELIQPGDVFPELQLVTPATAEDRDYLQLTGEIFTPSQIKAELLLVEFLNVHCPHCQSQAPVYNELFRLIEENPETRGKIKLLGLAVGNLNKEVKKFKQAYQVPFPILADPRFETLRAIGGSSTPLSIYIRQHKPGKAGIVSGVGQGFNKNAKKLYQRLIQLAAVDPEELKRQTQAAAEKQARLQPILPAAELETRVRTALTRFGVIKDFAKLALISGRQVYTAAIDQAGKRERLFAEVTSRASVCDICHDVHFIYLFDRSTRIIGFEPLQLTKYGNHDWDKNEVETMRNRVLGKHLTAPQPFDPAVDAISSATMTSAIIFDSLAQGEGLIKELRDLGLL
ncbi:MAG: redoxin domain-containing protein [Desulfuromusa sp.]|nr:redoxin domain-containing protein [Desulfuromusa sp.]